MREKKRERASERDSVFTVYVYIWNAFFSDSHPFRVEMCVKRLLRVCVCVLCMYVVVIVIRNPKCRQYSVDPNNKHFFYFECHTMDFIE